MKKLFALALSVLMLLGMLEGCAPKETQDAAASDVYKRQILSWSVPIITCIIQVLLKFAKDVLEDDISIVFLADVYMDLRSEAAWVLRRPCTGR